MKYKLLFFLSLLFLCGCITNKEVSQLSEDKSLRYPIGVDGKWGFADVNGKTIIPPRYDTVHFFGNGVALAKLDGKFGYLKKDGNWHLKPKYDFAKDFSSNCTRVSINRDTFLIDRKGKKKHRQVSYSKMGGGCKIILPAKPEKYFIKIGDHYELEYTYFVRHDSISYSEITDTSNLRIDEVIEYSNDYILVKKDQKFGFFYIWDIRKSNMVVDGFNPPNPSQIMREKVSKFIDFKYDEVSFKSNYGSAITIAKFKLDGKYGVLNGFGKEILPAKFYSLKIHSGYQSALVEYEPGKFGFKKFSGEEYFRRE